MGFGAGVEDLGWLGPSHCGAPAPAATLLLRACSLGRVDETLLRRAASRGVLEVRATGDVRDVRRRCDDAINSRAGSDVATGEAECASLNRRPKIFQASRELCCITLTGSFGEGNHAGEEESLPKRSGGSSWRHQTGTSGFEDVRANPPFSWGEGAGGSSWRCGSLGLDDVLGATASYCCVVRGSCGVYAFLLSSFGKRRGFCSCEGASWSNM